MRLSTLTRVLFFLISAPALAADQITIYEANSRPAEELVQLVRSLIPGVRVSAVGNKVAINAGPETTRKVMQVFSELDQAPRGLLIEARVLGQNTANESSLFARVRRGHGKVEVSDQRAEGAGSQIQSVRAVQGTASVVVTPAGAFYVKVKSVNKTTATAELWKSKEAGSYGFAISSEVTAPLGEWTTVGSSGENTQQRETGLTGRSQSASRGRQEIQLRITSGPQE